MDACGIDKLRDLVTRQHHAKHNCDNGYLAAPLDEASVERQVCTYIAQGTTVAQLTKCVETIEKESIDRIEGERAERREREKTQRILRVIRAAKVYRDGYEGSKVERPSVYEYDGYHSLRCYSLQEDISKIEKELADA